MIDFHMHLGRIFREEYPERVSLSVHQLVDWMNRVGIGHGILLPLESPEGAWGYFLNEEAVAARNAYPDRFTAFCCADPRYPNAERLIEHFAEHHGCRGFGEHVNGLAFDDPLNKRLYAKCAEHGLPILFEICEKHCWDEEGLPRLEACLKEFPAAVFVGHGPAFWSAISAEDPRRGYPEGPVAPGGAVDRLLRDYDNLYADLSAYSGYNALTRDPAYTPGFIERHWRKLLWGSDIVGPKARIPQLEWIRNTPMAEPIRRAIAHENAARLLNLDTAPEA